MDCPGRCKLPASVALFTTSRNTAECDNVFLQREIAMSLRFLLLLPASLFLSCCAVEHSAGPVQYDSKTLDAEGAQSVHASLHMGAGDMRISDGAQQLVRADFSYNVPSWKPEVKYTKAGTRGDLTIRQPEGMNVHVGNNRYRWELLFNNKIPMDMDIHFGAGQARLDLGSLDLRGVELHMGVGQVDMDLRGKLKHSYDV